MKKFINDKQVCLAFEPRTGANTQFDGDRVSLALYDSVTLIYIAESGAASNGDQKIKLRQSTANTAGTSKDITGVDWYLKSATDVQTVGQASHSRTTEITTVGEEEQILLAEVTADQLDVNGGFKFVYVRVDGVGTDSTKVHAGVYELNGGRYMTDPTELPSALA